MSAVCDNTKSSSYKASDHYKVYHGFDNDLVPPSIMGAKQSVMLVVSISITVMICLLVADYLIIVEESFLQ